MCPTSGCVTGSVCSTFVSPQGEQADVCVPAGETCSGPRLDAGTHTSAPDAGAHHPGSPDAGDMCGALAGPSVPSSCRSCTVGTGDCQVNGCYGGWYCNTDNDKCQPPPSTCTPLPDAGIRQAPDAAPAQHADAGTVVTGGGGVTSSGGSVAALHFAVVGDTRPAVQDDNKGYPTAVITQIYQDLESLSPRPAFAVTTGDYNFASTSSSNAATQIGYYMGARAKFSNPVFYTMGNHECSGYTASNCASTTTKNFSAFKSQMLGSIGQTKPYYSIPINAADGSWTAKLVFVAANAWDTTQSTWLDGELARSTTYTFIFRHEPSAATTAPGTSPSDKIIAKYPYTLLIVGHTHTYQKDSTREVTIGLGGAPATGGYNFGYLLVDQQANGDIKVTEHDYDTGATNATFTVTP
jgi:hypothetical protein